ncbi:hypothetical protein RVR_5787 [Actinacidiphila reveromycinica]|uniref:Uncharacterized protein n=1 Tax=Actinacidiphila reveromycinica TaxID=659352 RepID=A0A7U3UUZ2_9ACTN|nr:hypothetical protein [Streptomyces sp. SN-593]BBA99248.1 hypothetical protein RVR_5787 [Streptomyces sp. SN-593]
MNSTDVVALGDHRDTTFVIQTVPVSSGECSAERGACGKAGVIAVRNTVSHQRPAESSTQRVTLCAGHEFHASRMHELWVDDARRLQDPNERAAFLAAAGVHQV